MGSDVLRIDQTRERRTRRIPIAPLAAEKLRALKAKRPATAAEQACIAALGWQLGVPADWVFDDEEMCFRAPRRE